MGMDVFFGMRDLDGFFVGRYGYILVIFDNLEDFIKEEFKDFGVDGADF